MGRHPSRVSHLVMFVNSPNFDSSFYEKHTQEHWRNYASEDRKKTLDESLEKLGNVKVYNDFPTWYKVNRPRFWKDYSIDVLPLFDGIKPNYSVLEHLILDVFNECDSTPYLSEVKFSASHHG